MKILHLIYDDMENPWLAGGGSFATFEINRRLAKKHDIVVATGNFPGAKNEIREGVKYIRLGDGKNYGKSRFSYMLKSKKLIKRGNYDLIVDDFSPFSPTFSFFYSKKPIICSLRNIFLGHMVKKYGLKGIIFSAIEKYCLKRYKRFLVYSPSMVKKLKRLTKRNVSFVPRGISFNEFKKGKEENYILFLGRGDVYQKGLDNLVKVFKSIKSDIDLVIAGKFKKEDVRKLSIDKRIKFVGRKEGKEKIDFLSNCLFVCMPSRYESWGAVAIEASSSGKAIIGSKIDGLKDSIIDGETGILIRNNLELKKAIEYLIKDKKARKKLGDNGFKLAKKFDWDIVVKEQEKIYSYYHAKKKIIS